VYSRGYKKRAIAEKMFETLAILAVVYNVVFRVFSFYLAQEKPYLHVGGFIFTPITKWPP
jgi:hypothetical protein